MKIRTQLIISSALFGIALLVIAASLINTQQQIDRLNTQDGLAKNIELMANELSYLSNDYLLFREPHQLDRWESKYASISCDISNLTVDKPDQQVLVSNIKGNQLQLKNIFDDIVSKAESQPLSQPNSIDTASIQVSWSRINVQAQGLVFEASRLSQNFDDEKNQLNQINNLLIIILLGTFGVFLITNYLLIFRRTLKSISNLQSWTRIVGSGNLDLSIDDTKNDEFGELSMAFNQMASQLKTVTTSKADLEREVAERQRVGEALKVMNEELKQAKMQSELYLDLMGHDISNIHQIAIAHLEMAQEVIDDEKLPVEYNELIETPLAALLRSARLINNVRKLQQLQAGLYKSESVDLSELLSEVVNEYSVFPGKDVKITYWSPGASYTTANPLLKDVFTNLIDNAIKHCGDSPVIHVSISTSGDGRLYHVTVEDNGSGIDDSRKEEIFLRFKRGETAAKGTGLGLYLVKTLVESFGGCVKVEDRVPGEYTKGSRFIVSLPVEETMV